MGNFFHVEGMEIFCYQVAVTQQKIDVKQHLELYTNFSKLKVSDLHYKLISLSMSLYGCETCKASVFINKCISSDSHC